MCRLYQLYDRLRICLRYCFCFFFMLSLKSFGIYQVWQKRFCALLPVVRAVRISLRESYFLMVMHLKLRDHMRRRPREHLQLSRA